MNADNPYASPAPESNVSEPTERLEPPQEIAYELREEDMLATLLYLQNESSVAKQMLNINRWRLRKLAGWIALLGGFLCLTDGDLGSRVPFSAVLCWIVTGSFVFVSFRIRKTTGKEAKKVFRKMIEAARESAIFGQHTCAVDTERVSVDDQTGSRSRYWWSIDRIEATENYLYVFLADHEALAIPARAFVNESRFVSFCELVNHLWREGQRSKPSLASTAEQG